MDRGRTLFFSWCAAIAMTTAIASANDRLAPADEYFGQMKMSPLEVTNRISDAEHGSATLDTLLDTQDAIEDWTQKYPDDPWIAPREFRLLQLFAGLHSHDGDVQADRCRDFMHVHFPDAQFTASEEGAK